MLIVKLPGNIAHGLGQGQTAEISVTIRVDDGNPPVAQRMANVWVIGPADVHM
jgi:hypothetical protein